jgi:hypothetical protein
MARSDRDSPQNRQWWRHHAYVEPPDLLQAFPEAARINPKGRRRRWRDQRGMIYEWDSRHGAVEVYDSLGRHLGEYDHVSGKRLKQADPARRIEP